MITIKKIFFLLTDKEIYHAFLLLILIFLSSLLDMMGVASILPFIAVLSNPSSIETNYILNRLYKFSEIFNVDDHQKFLFFLGLGVFLLVVISLFLKALMIYAQLRFVQMRHHSISRRLISNYLNQPYSWFIKRNSAEIGKTILSEVGIVINNGVYPLILLISGLLTLIMLFLLLVFNNPFVTSIVAIVFSASYLLIYKVIQSGLIGASKTVFANNQLRFKSISETFGATKEIKISGVEKIFIKRFSNASATLAKNQSFVGAITTLPRFILEIIGFGGIIILILYLMSKTGSIEDSLPLIALYAFAGYRMLPALQQVFSSYAKLNFVKPSLESLYKDLKNTQHNAVNKNHGKIILKKSITLKSIYYSYPGSSRIVLNNVNIQIPAGKTIGLIGKTGSGKTTIIDIILGLLEPKSGKLLVDNQIITKKNLNKWQKSIGYVPQQIYLTDDTISSNIAFGVDVKTINKARIKRVAKIANLQSFIEDELPDKYDTNIGERGVKLSGGQRQRIGIARALYHKPKVLIFDEATSAVDGKTEKLIIEAIDKLSKNITVIFIAHRLETLKNCDLIYKIEKGKIVNKGSYKEVILKS